MNRLILILFLLSIILINSCTQIKDWSSGDLEGNVYFIQKPCDPTPRAPEICKVIPDYNIIKISVYDKNLYLVNEINLDKNYNFKDHLATGDYIIKINNLNALKVAWSSEDLPKNVSIHDNKVTNIKINLYQL